MPFFTAEDGVPLYYTDEGEGTPILLIHGITMNHKFFQQNAPVFAKTHRVVTLDIRGHGYSGKQELNWTLRQAARDVRKLIAHLNLSDVTLVGWSMGTTLIYNYFDQFGGEQLKGAVFMDMSPYLLKVDDWEHAMFGNLDYKTAIEVTHNIFSDRIAALEGLIAISFKAGQPPDFATKELWMRESMLTPNSAMAAFWLSMLAADWRSGPIPVPVLLCYGSQSVFFPTPLGKALQASIPNSHLVMFEQSGHSLFWEEPDRFNAEVARFVG
ncbi:alpha/beta hydrolase [Kamptonema cortianum]|nr:alpha/beta hydrolase [Desertifilum sp.]MDK3155106.1 alpha/beta hydrolase [Kamptonema cortianum]